MQLATLNALTEFSKVRIPTKDGMRTLETFKPLIFNDKPLNHGL